ncbi:MAG: T9SS type A sorting domain-containing protein [Flavobacteriales bacterium]|nr:T9SS type A sorting domain-containing protein [Flavobacteriales bacterium]
MRTQIFYLFILLTFGVNHIRGQVDRQILIEHFTNTVCSVCASKNPGLNANLENHPEIIRISYHPSSPYSSCLLSQHNVTENDERTNFYNIYGATPRIVINGEEYPTSVDFGALDLFDSYENLTSPFLMNTYIDSITQDSIYVSVKITRFEGVSFTHTPFLYAGLAEDTIVYSAPNGEVEHYGVFRKKLIPSYMLESIPSLAIGDSTTMSFTVKVSPDWNLTRIFAFSTIHYVPGNSIVQSSTSTSIQTAYLSITEEEGNEGFDLHFNGVSNQLSILKNDCNSSNLYEIISLNGSVMSRGSLTGNLTYIDLNNISAGMYLVRLINQDLNSYSKTVKFVK